MAITEITAENLKKAKPGWLWDKKRKLFVTWEVTTQYLGRRHKRRGFRTETDAEEYLRDLKLKERAAEVGLIREEKYPLVSELFEMRLRDIENRPERVRAERVFKVFIKINGDKKIDEVIKNDFRLFADHRLSQKVSKKTVNREINPISKAFSSASDYFNLTNFRPPRVFKYKVSRAGRKRIISISEYEQFLEFLGRPRFESHEKDYVARKRTALVFQFLAMSGLRHGEVCALEKEKLTRSRREINVYRFKTRRWKIFAPLTDTHLELMDQGAKLYPDSKFFFSEAGKIHMKTYSIIKRACKQLEIPYGKKRPNGFVLHDLRHTFTSVLHENLIDNKTTTEFTDNPSAVVDYQHSTAAARERAMEIIEKKFGTPEKIDRLRKIFEAVRSGQMKFEEFRDSIG